MKMMVTDTMLMPTYVSRFSCIGGDCEDTCCAGWGITLDKESYLSYLACFDPVLRPRFAKHVKRYPHSKSTGDYGHLELLNDESRTCGLLSEKRLCLIHERLGEKALSDTCSYYPRTVHRFGDLHRMTLMLSCPEAARLALLEEDAFGFVGEEATVSWGFISDIKPKGGLTLAEMEEVHTLMFQILRSQDVRLPDRIKLIGLFCERLTGLILKRETKALPELLLEMEGDLESGAAMVPLAGLVELPEVQAQFTGAFYLQGRNPHQSPHVLSILGEVDKGLGIQPSLAPEGPALVAAYEEGLARLAPALEAVPWLLEHYLFNEFLRELFPWAKTTPMQHYANLVLRFATVRLMLAGRAAACGATLTPLELAETIQVASRRYLHDANLTKGSEQAMVDTGWDSLERLFALL